MKIVIAPNALKGSLSARAAAAAMARGVRRAAPQAKLVLLPVADGGDGLLDVLEDVLQVERLPLSVTGPLNTPVGASFLYDPSRRLAVIEMATAAGLALLTPDRYNPLDATSFGVGELVKAALDRGAARIILGIGGSATNDGGTGMARALGARFLDQAGNELPGDGASLAQINNIRLDGLDPRLGQVDIQVISDVDNPLLGEHGAARVFAPQKGASPEQVIQLEAGLAQMADVIEQDLGQDVREHPGAGAAGGLGAGLIAFLQAELTAGAGLVLELLELKQALAGADLVLTAEGRLDEQTRHGKAPAAVATRARALGIPCLALAGSLGPGSEETLLATGIDASFSLCPGPVNLTQAMQDASQYLAAATEQVLRCFLAGYNTQLPAQINQKTSP
ncbi:MAG: glycerate kinase [Halobacteria archaeon]|nr:glycerate kinase [Halobacteria archaeon]